MPRFGLKLGIHDVKLLPFAVKFWQEKRYEFLELFVPRDTSPECTALWKWYDGTLVLHAPHSVNGFNFSCRRMATENAMTLELIEILRERLNPAMVVFHPGLDGDAEEMFSQVAFLQKEYPDLHRIMLLENKPRLGLNGEHCLGSSPAEIQTFLDETGCGFCCDVRHAFAYAAWAGLGWQGVLEDFTELNPRLWHAADGNVTDTVDSHLHIGEGTMEWKDIGSFWNKESLVTIECAKEQEKMLEDFLQDLAALQNHCSAIG